MLARLLRDLQQPEYLHTLLNPLPIYGLGIALLGLVIATLIRSRAAQVTALVLVLICAASIWPTMHYGERAADRMAVLADEDGRAWLAAHGERAEKLAYVYYALAIVTAAALLVPRKWPKFALPLTILTIALALGSLGAGAYIGSAGGKSGIASSAPFRRRKRIRAD